MVPSLVLPLWCCYVSVYHSLLYGIMMISINSGSRGSRAKLMGLGAGFGCGDAYRLVAQKNQPPVDTKKLAQYIPSELRLGQKWDYTIQQFGMRTLGYGFVAAIASIVLARKLLHIVSMVACMCIYEAFFCFLFTQATVKELG